jgi:hypothetical protein
VRGQGRLTGIGRGGPAVAGLAAALLLAAGNAMAMTSPLPPVPVPAASTIAPSFGPGNALAVAGVGGFRSARFGMSEAEVRAAIGEDFGVESRAIVAGENAAERTRLLRVTAADVLPGGGTATVSYVFGYQSKALIQIGVAWSSATDSSMTATRLSANGETLRHRLLAAGYRPETIQTGLVLPSGLLLFRGEDSAGHATILILEGRFEALAGSQEKSLTPTSLALLYSLNPQHPDVFRLAPGSF